MLKMDRGWMDGDGPGTPSPARAAKRRASQHNRQLDALHGAALHCALPFFSLFSQAIVCLQHDEANRNGRVCAS